MATLCSYPQSASTAAWEQGFRFSTSLLSCSLTFKGWVRLGVDWLPAEPTPEETLDLFNFGDVRVLALVALVLLAANNQLFSSSIYLLGWIQVSFVTKGVDIISRNTTFEESAYWHIHI